MTEAQAKLQTITVEPVINDFSITVATVNGSGSQTSNTTIMRALFKMGIPVSGKNIFPSNIQGLPTWYTIRASKDGFIARRENHEIIVAMNPASFLDDVADVQPGGVLLYNDSIKLNIDRDDITAYPMPVRDLVRQIDVPSNLRDYVANMVYVGVLAYILDIDMDAICDALEFHFKGKRKPIDLNFGLVTLAYEWAEENLTKTDPYRVEPMNKTEGLIMADGNTAAALGSLYGGMQFCAWYPITPASSLAEALIEYVPILRQDPEEGEDGKRTYTCAVVQAEDELAAIGMSIGAGWGGLRAMTSTSGPGISLMSEYIGLAYFTEVPVVIWNVQRVGPSTGLPTRTAQGDITICAFCGHGDSQNIMLLPGTINEIFEHGWKAFDIAERLQTPVFILTDLDFGMNQWMTEPFRYPDTPMDRGKILWEEDLEKLKGEWGRYLDVDGDNVPYRTVPGNRHPAAAYFTRGTGHDEMANYSEAPEVWEANMLRLKKKFESASQYVPKPVVESTPGARIGLIAYGSTDPAVKEARFRLEEKGVKVDYLRLRAYPFTDEVLEFIRSHDVNYIIELNRDGQMFQLMQLAYPDECVHMVSLAHIDGLPLTPRWVVEAIESQEAS